MATETLSEKALEADIYNAVPTEKVDGTCCYVTTYKGNKEDPYTSFSCWLVAFFSWSQSNSYHTYIEMSIKLLEILLSDVCEV